MMSFCRIILLGLIFIWTVNSRHHKVKDGKLILNPMELIDLVAKEKTKVDKQAIESQLKKEIKIDKHLLDTDEIEITTTKNSEDKDALRTRKMWSRWSKWSHCSVTCGEGLIRRQRVCVAGRCAPGECEEQQRPCARMPCAAAADVAEDLHDFE